MKNKIVYALALVIIVVALIIGGWSDTHYSTTAKVYMKDGNSTLMVDGAGDVWEAIDRDDLPLDSFVTISFFNNGTDYTRKDDVITNIKVDK